jgi:uncharacterized protein YdhG (YjbR/CyaY superfamily)
MPDMTNTNHGCKPKNIDECLAAVSGDKRAALERLRKIIRAAVPKADECISYQLPAFRLGGKCFVWFGAAANHCAIYPAVGDHKDELKDYDTSKGTIRFQADKAMPAALVRKLIKARIGSKQQSTVISDRISRYVNAPRAAVYQAPSKSSFLIRVDIINRPTSCNETLGLASSTPNDEYVLA